MDSFTMLVFAYTLADDSCLDTDARPRKLRSADTRTLLVSRTRTNFGDRAFSAAGPRVWNDLLTDLRRPDLSCSRFRQSPKTLLFGQCDQSAQCEFPRWLHFRNPLTYLFTYC